MRRTSLIAEILIVAFVLHAPLALGADAPYDRVAELLTVSGDRAALSRIVDALSTSVTAALSTIADPDETERIVTQAITVERLFDRFVSGTARGFDAERASRLLVWLRTPVVQRITQLEVTGATASESEIAAYEARPDPTPDPARARLFERLDAAMHATEANVALALAIQRGLARGALPPSAPMPPGIVNETATRALVDSRRPHMVAQQRYTYRELTTEELASYVEMLEQDDQQWFARLSQAALADAVESACEEAARRTLESARDRAPGERA